MPSASNPGHASALKHSATHARAAGPDVASPDTAAGLAAIAPDRLEPIAATSAQTPATASAVAAKLERPPGHKHPAIHAQTANPGVTPQDTVAGITAIAPAKLGSIAITPAPSATAPAKPARPSAHEHRAIPAQAATPGVAPAVAAANVGARTPALPASAPPAERTPVPAVATPLAAATSGAAAPTPRDAPPDPPAPQSVTAATAAPPMVVPPAMGYGTGFKAPEKPAASATSAILPTLTVTPPAATPQVAAARVDTAAPAATPGAQLVPALIQVARSAAGQQITVRLAPAELGRVDIRIDRASDGSSSGQVLVERPETLKLLQTDQPQLNQALDKAGVPQEGRSLTLSLSLPDPGGAHTGSGGNFAGDQPGDARQHRPTPQDTAPPAASPLPDPTPTPGWRRAGINITA